jgi:hypothetical protein
VFLAIKGDLAFRWPPKLKTDPFRRDWSKYCEYHTDHGRSTEDCMSIRREIETFIQNGKLVRFLTQERIQEANQQRRLEGGQEGLGHAEPRRRDKAPRAGRRDREEEQRNAREKQRPL